MEKSQAWAAEIERWNHGRHTLPESGKRQRQGLGWEVAASLGEVAVGALVVTRWWSVIRCQMRPEGKVFGTNPEILGHSAAH